MSQPQQQLPGAVIILALSIATLAAVLAGMERGRSRRHARGWHTASSGTFPDQPSVSNESCRPRSPALHAAGTAWAPTTMPSDSAVPGGCVDQGEVRAAVGAPPSAEAASVGPAAQGQRLEILVHNISHKDMVLSLRRTRRAAKPLPQRPAGQAISNVIDAVSCSTTDTFTRRVFAAHAHTRTYAANTRSYARHNTKRFRAGDAEFAHSPRQEPPASSCYA